MSERCFADEHKPKCILWFSAVFDIELYVRLIRDSYEKSVQNYPLNLVQEKQIFKTEILNSEDHIM